MTIEEWEKFVEPGASGDRIGRPVPIDTSGFIELREVLMLNLDVEPFVVTDTRNLLGGELTTLTRIAVVQSHEDAVAKRVAELLKLLEQ